MELKPTGSLASVESVIVDERGKERPQGKAELFFAHLEPGEGVPKLLEPVSVATPKLPPDSTLT